MNSTACVIINDLLDVSPYQRYFLSIFYIILGIFGTLLNIIPTYIVVRTKQQKNPSARLAFYLSISDFLRASLGFFVYGMATLWYDKILLLKCWQQQLLISPFILFSISSAYLHCLIILDRFFRIAFIQSYSSFFTTKRFVLLMVIYLLVVALQFSLAILGDHYFGIHMGGVLLTMPFNLVLFLLSIILHLKSIHQLRIHQKTICLTLGSRNVLKLATIYLAIFLVFYAPVVLSLLVIALKKYHTLEDSSMVQIIVITLAIASFSCPVNAVAFVVKNIHARNHIRKRYNTFRRSNIFQMRNKVTTTGDANSANGRNTGKTCRDGGATAQT